MHPLHSRAPQQYAQYSSPSFQPISSGQRRLRHPSKFFDIEFGNDLDTFRPPPQRTWSSRTYNFDEIIGMLDSAIKTVHEDFKPLAREFASDISRIRFYAEQSVIDTLWETRLDINPKVNHRGSRRSSELVEEGSSLEGMIRTSRQAKRAQEKLEKALQAATQGTKTGIGSRRRKLKIAENRKAMERTVSKLRTSGSQCLDLLNKSKKTYSQVETLMKELNFLDQIIDEWRDFADDVDEGMEVDDEQVEDYE